MRKQHALLALVVAFAMVVMACGGSTPSPSPAQQASSAPSAKSSAPAASQAPYSPLTYMGADRAQRLVAEAKKEGKVTWYTGLTGQIVQQMSEAFKKDYGIEVESYRAAETQLVTRVVQEDQANRNVVDVIEVPSTGALELVERKLVQPYYTPEAKNLPKELTMPASGDLVVGISSNMTIFAFASNKEMVPANLVPKNLEDLLNPGLKGKLAVASSTTGIRWIGMVLSVLGDAKGREFLSKLAAQQVRVESISAAALMDLIAQGQVAASPTIFQSHFSQHAAKGVAAEWIPLNNTAATNIGMTLIGKKAPNPAAGVLFGEYLAAGTGAKILTDLGYTPSSTKLPYKAWVPGAGLNAEQYAKQFETWQELFDKTFGN